MKNIVNDIWSYIDSPHWQYDENIAKDVPTPNKNEPQVKAIKIVGFNSKHKNIIINNERA